METPKRIHLLGTGRHEEGRAAAAITPGHLLILDSNGKVAVHDDEAGPAERLFALEDALQGRSITDDYKEDEVVGFVVAAPGDVVYAFLAGGEDVDAGDFLTSNGDGTLKKLSNGDVPIAVALEALDLSDSSSEEDTHIRARVL